MIFSFIEFSCQSMSCRACFLVKLPFWLVFQIYLFVFAKQSGVTAHNIY